MNAQFDIAALAVVAYAQVDGKTGASTVCNSGGLKTAKRPGGGYYVSLASQLTEDPSRNLIFIQPTSTKQGPPQAFSLLIDNNATTKVVMFGNGTTVMDTSFSILVLRTTITPPVGAPA